MTDYTNAERKRINKGWEAIINIAEGGFDYRAKQRLKDGLRYERKDRDSITTAKAVMCGSFVEGHDAPLSAAALFDVSPGCAQAIMFGAVIGDNPKGYAHSEFFPKWIDMARDAKAAFGEHIQRILAEAATVKPGETADA